MGEGKFWQDSWCGNDDLKVFFPSLFSIDASKDAWVNELWRGPEAGRVEAPIFTRHFNDWEVEEAERFLAHIERVFVANEVEDKLKWEETVPKTVEHFPWTLVWKSSVQLKICFLFIWEPVWGQLQRPFTLANRCYLFLEKEESADHIILHCVKTRLLWELLFSLLRVVRGNPKSVWDTMLSGMVMQLGKKRKKVWQAEPFCLS